MTTVKVDTVVPEYTCYCLTLRDILLLLITVVTGSDSESPKRSKSVFSDTSLLSASILVSVRLSGIV